MQCRDGAYPGREGALGHSGNLADSLIECDMVGSGAAECS